MDQGVIVPIKHNYWKNIKEILLRCDEKYDNLINSLKKVTIKDVIFWIVVS